MKKIFKYLLCAGLATLPIATMTTVLASCTTKIDYSNTSVARFYNIFLNENHGRYAGNNYNFSNLKNDGTGLNIDSRPLYDLSTKLESNINNYGSYHAYLWLVDTITKMGYSNLNKDFINLNEATITKNNEQNKPTITITPSSGTALLNNNIIYGDKNINEDLFYKTGLVTQPFLWNKNDTYNNRGFNIVVTINPDENISSTNDPYDFYIASHYDSTGADVNSKSWGATDNGTGVALNLSLLEYFSKPENKSKLKSRLHILFVDAEEVGIYGSQAFVGQFLGISSNLKQSSWGMINLDTIAGGDYIYVHSPDTRNVAAGSNTSAGLRQIINKISKAIANNKKDNNYYLNIHEQYVEDEYKAGETGDWSDHVPFYKNANIPIAYIESTNFALKSKYDTFDGYSQTINPNAWIQKNGDPTNLKKTVNEKGQTIWVLPDGLTLDHFKIKGDIWHTDLDEPQWLNTYIGEQKIYKQLNVVFDTLVSFLENITPSIIK